MINKDNLAYDRFTVSTVDSHHCLVPDYVSSSGNDATAVGDHVGSRAVSAFSQGSNLDCRLTGSLFC